MDEFRHFAFHCRYGYLNNTLKDYLFSLEVPCPKFLMTTSEVLPPWKDDKNILLRDSMWHFLRTLNREVGATPKRFYFLYILSTFKDFDSSGRVYKQYMGQWIGYLSSTVPEKSPLKVPVFAQEMFGFLPIL